MTQSPTRSARLRSNRPAQIFPAFPCRMISRCSTPERQQKPSCATFARISPSAQVLPDTRQRRIFNSTVLAAPAPLDPHAETPRMPPATEPCVGVPGNVRTQIRQRSRAARYGIDRALFERKPVDVSLRAPCARRNCSCLLLDRKPRCHERSFLHPRLLLPAQHTAPFQ